MDTGRIWEPCLDTLFHELGGRMSSLCTYIFPSVKCIQHNPGLEILDQSWNIVFVPLTMSLLLLIFILTISYVHTIRCDDIYPTLRSSPVLLPPIPFFPTSPPPTSHLIPVFSSLPPSLPYPLPPLSLPPFLSSS